MIVRLANTTGRDEYIDITRNGNYAELTDKNSESPSWFFRIPLGLESANIDKSGMQQKMDQISTIFNAIDKVIPDKE